MSTDSGQNFEKILKSSLEETQKKIEEVASKEAGALASKIADEYTSLEVGTLDEQAKKVDLFEKKQNIREKKKYARHLFGMLCIWLTLMMGILILNGFGKIPFTCLKFSLSDSVIITLITTTTANVAAFFLVVTKHLFPSQS